MPLRLIHQARSLLTDGRPPEAGAEISLALQGGGSFGAFTWGALDRLLQEDGLRFEAVSGASAGAVNAVLMAAGLVEDGREGAREKLARFWRKMSQSASFLPLSAFPSGFGALARAMSPYQFNPFDLNPLRRALEEEVDFDKLRGNCPVKLLISATRVSDGSLRIFRNDDLSVEAVLASACLPMIHRTVEIDGEDYWDGGYVSNPPLIPLVRESEAREVLIVQVTPNRSAGAPVTPREIERRLSQIAFNATLNAEIEALRLAAQLRATKKMSELVIARIAAEDEIEDLGAQSAGNLGWTFLEKLRDAGGQAAETWLAERRAGTVRSA